MNLISDSSFSTILRGRPLSRKCLLNFFSVASDPGSLISSHKRSTDDKCRYKENTYHSGKGVCGKVLAPLKCVKIISNKPTQL